MFKGILGLIMGLISFLSLVVIALAAVFLTLPDVRSLKGCLTTELYHVQLCDSSPDFVKYEQISPYVIGAIIMSEDASFYTHPGVDFYEMKESIKRDLNEGRFARGASTITQQLAKNVFLSKNKNVLRKLEEIYLAFQIEKYFSKKRILTLYLNVVEMGEGFYGIKAACRHYFKKSPIDVNPEEAAYLAFLLPNPKKYSQSFYSKKLTPFAEKTIKTILHKMLLGHKINEGEYAVASARLSQFPWNEAQASGPVPTEVWPPHQEGPSSDTTESTEEDDFQFDFTPEENP